MKKKIVILVIVVILLIFIASTLRKVIIIKNLNERYSENITSANSNVYQKSLLNNNKYKLEKFKKDDIVKEINDNIVIIETPNEQKIFYMDENKMSVGNYGEDNEHTIQIRIPNFVEYEDIMDLIKLSVFSKIKIHKSNISTIYSVDTGLYDCIKSWGLFQGIKNKLNTNWELIKYIDKNTGLPTKTIYKVNGTSKYNDTDIWKYGIVTDEDIKEPDNTEYQIINNEE